MNRFCVCITYFRTEQQCFQEAPFMPDWQTHAGMMHLQSFVRAEMISVDTKI